MPTLVEKIISCHQALQKAQIPHAFGGALALAWCTQAARGTIDIDVNLFVGTERAAQMLDTLPSDIKHAPQDLERLVRDTQIRLWWEATPVDIFLNSTDFHEEASQRIRWEAFAGHTLPFLSCPDIAVFKAFFNRTKDWADIEAMHEAGTLDWRFVAGVMIEYLGADDERVQRLRSIALGGGPQSSA